MSRPVAGRRSFSKLRKVSISYGATGADEMS